MGIRSAYLGTDGKTVLVILAGGIHGAILPSSTYSPVQRDRHHFQRSHSGASDATGVKHAIVLEPFATQLKLGAGAGNIEAGDLRYAGYAVDSASNQAVTVQTMGTLWKYDVVYMLTHSGVNQYGEGVIATGQLAHHEPEMDPLIKEGSVYVVGVVGSTQYYYGILTGFIRNHEPPLPAHALWFLNGCSLLQSTLLWNALSNKGAGAMVGWDGEGTAPDDSAAAAEFFGNMIRGKSVAEAVAGVIAAGYGTSTSPGFVAHFGFTGDGNLRLADHNPQTATPTLTPVPLPSNTPSATDTATPTSMPTSTPDPTATTQPTSTSAQNRPAKRGPIRHRRCKKAGVHRVARCRWHGK
ncbi:MAG: hypothetical protein NVSMB52_06370 [Chloroflexota bacterium]